MILSGRYFLYCGRLLCATSISQTSIWQPKQKLSFSSGSKYKRNSRRFATLGLLSFATYGAYTYFSKANCKPIDVTDVESQLELLPSSYVPTRKITSLTDNSGLNIVIYQFQTCPFCCKVRAYLDFCGFSYDVVEVNSITRKEMQWSSYKKVPFVIIKRKDGTQILVKDSSVIISVLESWLSDRTQSLETLLSYYPYYKNADGKGEFVNRHYVMYGDNVAQGDTTLKRKSETEWREWVDADFVHVISPNIYRTLRESVDSFWWFDEHGEWAEIFSCFERYLIIYLGAAAMYVIGKLLKRKYNLADDVRVSLKERCAHWLKVSLKGKLFHGGDSPDLADLALFGVVNAIEGCAAFRELEMEIPSFIAWYKRVKGAVIYHKGGLAR